MKLEGRIRNEPARSYSFASRGWVRSCNDTVHIKEVPRVQRYVARPSLRISEGEEGEGKSSGG